MSNLVTGTDLITEERNRQLLVEGYTAANDDDYDDGELAAAASAYIIYTIALREAANSKAGIVAKYAARQVWPWEELSFKPGDDVRNLVKAGALIAAEIDRLQRVQKAQSASA